ncbi:MAG: extracellular solute-binding protein [Rivularia sp. (in: Bacteria)]|nr:extracellular solute-binding protein [Rivularia sp. MS3]
MHRRSFLFGTSTLLLSQMLVGCNASKQPQLTVQVLKGSIPGRILKEFQESLSQKAQLKFSPVVQLQQLFKQLRSLQKKEAAQKESEGFDISGLFGKSSAKNIDLLTLGDFWLKEAIEKELIQSLSPQEFKNWSNLSPKWQELVTRNNQGLADKQGKIWAAPYRWGSTVIIYRKDKLEKFDWEVKDWSDLWREELKGRISLLNQPREVIGLTLKKLGKSYNSENLQDIKSLKSELQILNNQVKFYNSTNYIEPLILGDTWLAVGWSNDIVSLLSRYPKLSVVVPNSGTALWADLWVQPKVTAKNQETQESLSTKWIDFCWKPEIAKQIAVLTKANSPIDIEIPASEIAKPLQNVLSANPEVFEKSEFLLPLSPSAAKEYDSLFRKIKSS